MSKKKLIEIFNEYHLKEIDWLQFKNKICELITQIKKEDLKIFDDIEKIKNCKGKHLLNQIDIENEIKYQKLKKKHLGTK